ncbi:MAG: M81 family metallopeptidase [Chloroflexi bacterium]|nr:M81 family metallopeptidase [Chloroflexota bacterium]
MKVFWASLATETNTFSPFPTTIADFQVIRASNADPNDPQYSGWFEGINVLSAVARDRGYEFVTSLAAFAEPAGYTVQSAYETLRDELLADLKAAMPVDIVMLDLHGAMVAQGYDDCEGDLTARVRELVGDGVKVGVELDLHCHLTQDLLDQADVVVSYKEYPHTDGLERAKELLTMLADAREGKIRPAMALFDCHMVGLFPTTRQPMRGFVDEMMALEGKDGVLSLSLAHGFPWGDVADMGVRMLAVTDDDLPKAQAVAERLGRRFFAMRHEVDQQPTPIEEVLDQVPAFAGAGKPVVIADITDNPGGGAPSDSTFALRAMLERGMTDAGIAMIWDPVVVDIAKNAGVGAKLKLRIGGKMGPMSGDPLDLEVEVVGVIPKMTQAFPVQNSDPVNVPCGDTVALHCQGIDIIVNSLRTQALSRQVFTNFGIELSQKRCLVVKSTQHFHAEYAPIAAAVFYAGAPGALIPYYQQLPYQKVTTDKYPWVDNPFELA